MGGGHGSCLNDATGTVPIVPFKQGYKIVDRQIGRQAELPVGSSV